MCLHFIGPFKVEILNRKGHSIPYWINNGAAGIKLSVLLRIFKHGKLITWPRCFCTFLLHYMAISQKNVVEMEGNLMGTKTRSSKVGELILGGRFDMGVRRELILV